MNDNLDDFLSSMGIESTPATSEEAIAEEVQTEVTTVQTASSEQMSNDDFTHLLNEVGLTTPPEADAEEVHDVQDIDFEDDDEEDEEEQTWEEAPVDPTANDEERDAQEPLFTNDGILDQLTDSRLYRYVGDRELVRVGDIRHNPNTGEYEILTEHGVVSHAPVETRDLDAEVDAVWQEVVDSGGVVPVSLVSDIDQVVHLHMPDGSVTHVPIVDEAHVTADTVATMIGSANTETAVIEESIPQNSPTLSMDNTTSRFSGAEWYNEIQSKSIILAGLGGIGSFLSLQLARMKPRALMLYDDDIVEQGNMSGQMYSRNEEGKFKVEAMRRIIGQYTSTGSVYSVAERFTDSSEAGDIMMCGFDNMEARKTFFESWHGHVHSKPVEERKKCLFLDGRLSVDTLQVFCLTGDDETNIKRYKDEYLFDDSEAEGTVCSLKQTTYMACMIGSFMVNLFVNWCGNLLNPIIPYDLPFFTEYNSQNMIFKITR